MKIVMLCDFYDESLTYQENLLTKFYVKHGHQVTVITSTFDSVFDYVNDRYDPTWRGRTYCANGATIIKLPYRHNFLNRVRRFARLDDLLLREAPDLIFIHDIMLNMTDAVRYLQRHPRTRMIMDYHADYSNSGKNWLSLKVLHGIVRKRALDKARPYLQRIFPIVPASARFLHEVYGVPHAEMELLPLGADLDLSREVQAASAGRALRLRYGIAPEATVIFTGGKLAPAKRTEMLIEAFLRIDRPDTYLFVVGNCAETDRDYKQMLELSATKCRRIHFTGWLDTRQVLEHLDMADLAVFPASQSILWQQSIGMGKPLIIGEPMAHANGKQDVSYLNLYDNIVLTDSRQQNAPELAVQLLRLIDDLVLRGRMADGAIRVARELLDWNNAVYKTLRFAYPA